MKWARHNPTVVQFVELLSHVTAVQFGLRPLNRSEEKKLVSDLLAAHAMRNLRVWICIFLVDYYIAAFFGHGGTNVNVTP